MRVRHTKTPIRRDFINNAGWPGIIMESDIPIEDSSKLRAKLLVFDTVKNFNHFWNTMRGSVGVKERMSKAAGCVNALSNEVITFDGGKESFRHIEVDPRYFCIISLISTRLYLEIICHECIHAGFAYAKRRKRDFWVSADELDEESVCYPSGRLASAIHRELDKHDMYRFTRFTMEDKKRRKYPKKS